MAVPDPDCNVYKEKNKKKRMNTPTDMDVTVLIRGSLDSTNFTFEATGNGTRIVVSTGLRKLFHQKYWIPIQKACPDLQPVDNNRESVPTKWFMEVTANPPAFVKPKHRLACAWST